MALRFAQEQAGLGRYNVAVDLSRRVAQHIADHQLLVRGERLIVGLSGGPDSLALLVLLLDLEYRPIAAHFDHGLRPESEKEGRAVEALTRKQGVEFVSQRGDVSRVARRGHRSLEEAAREMRYAFLVQTARRFGCRTIAVGHTADDQAETVLLHLLRGAGIEGLGGMEPGCDMHTVQRRVPSGELRLVRPLLTLTRAETEAACRARALTPLRDPSNCDTSFTRNRVRHELLPQLEDYNPAIRRLLAQTAEQMQGYGALTALAVERAWELCVCELPEHTLRIDRARFAALPRAVGQSLAYEALTRLLGARKDIAHRHAVDLVRYLLRPPRTGHAHLVRLIQLHSAGSFIFLRAMHGRTAVAAPTPIVVSAIPARVKAHAFGGRLEADLVSVPGRLIEADNWQVRIDADRITLPLTIRAARPGDRFWPLGGPRETLLARFLARQHVPNFMRPLQPVLADARRIVWVPGLRIAHDACLRAESRRVVRLSWVREAD